MRIFVAAGLIALSLSSIVRAEGASEPVENRVDAVVKAAAARDLFSGVVLVAKDGVPVYEGAFGKASREYDRPNGMGTQFSLASVNKTFTAIAVMRLAEPGKIGLDTSLDTYLGSAWIPLEDARRITIRHLLSHRSGLGDYLGRAAALPCSTKLDSVDDYKPLVAGSKLSFAPGTAAEYSNVGFHLLGAVIEKVTGESYDAHIRRTLLGPLGMDRTMAMSLDYGFTDLAQGYVLEKPSADNPSAPRWRSNTYRCSRPGGPGGGYYSTAGDMLRFATALQKGGLVRAETLEAMRQPQGVDNPAYGLGFTIRGGHIGHSGETAGVGTRFRIYPNGYVMIILGNLTGADDSIARDIETILKGEAAQTAG
jgi:CubicO group peptidase (beta-lactamase class C family)